MRLLDISSALVVSIVSLALLISNNPGRLQQGASDLATKAELQRAIVSVAGKVGFATLASASIEGVCAAMSRYSNASLIFSAVVRGEACAIPEAGSLQANLTISFPERKVVLQAWLPTEKA